MDRQTIIERAKKFLERINPMLTKHASLAAEIEQIESKKQALSSNCPNSVIGEHTSSPLASIMRKLGKVQDAFNAVESDMREEANNINAVILDLKEIAQAPGIFYEHNLSKMPFDRCKEAKDVIQLLLAFINDK